MQNSLPVASVFCAALSVCFGSVALGLDELLVSKNTITMAPRTIRARMDTRMKFSTSFPFDAIGDGSVEWLVELDVVVGTGVVVGEVVVTDCIADDDVVETVAD